METEEIYDVLMEQLIRVIHKYDPAYTDKVKLVVEIINHELSQRKQFSLADLNRHLEFDSHRCLGLLCRRGFLQGVKDGAQKIVGFRRAASWPPAAQFFQNGAIGVAYYIQKWFRFYLQDWILSITTSEGLERNISAPLPLGGMPENREPLP
jgi:hypothetical protein